MPAYEAACRAAGDEPYPPDDALLRQLLEGFALQYVATGKSHTSVTGYIYSVLKHVRLAGRPLNATQCELLLAKLELIAKDFPAVVTRAAPVTADDAQAIRAYLSPFAAKGGRYATQMLAVLAIARRGKFRIGEVMNLRWSAVVLAEDPRMLCVFIPLRKANKKTVSAADKYVIPYDDGDADPLRCLSAHATASGVSIRPHGSAQAVSGETVFTPMRVNGTQCSKSADAWASGELRRLYALAGLPPPPSLMRRSSQGLRRGGATEQLEAGLSRKDVMKGGWSSKEGFAPYDVAGHKLAAHIAGRVIAAGRPIKP